MIDLSFLIMTNAAAPQRDTPAADQQLTKKSAGNILTPPYPGGALRRGILTHADNFFIGYNARIRFTQLPLGKTLSYTPIFSDLRA